MSIATSILPEFDQEMANTRRVLERIPEDKLSNLARTGTETDNAVFAIVLWTAFQPKT